MCQYVICHNDTGNTTFRTYLASQLETEEFINGVDTTLTCHYRNIACRFNTQRSDAMFIKACQQATIIACDLNNQVVGTKSQPGHHLCRILLVVSCHCLRGSGDINVVTEQDLRCNNIK